MTLAAGLWHIDTVIEKPRLWLWGLCACAPSCALISGLADLDAGSETSAPGDGGSGGEVAGGAGGTGGVGGGGSGGAEASCLVAADGARHLCAALADDRTRCWGENLVDQVGSSTSGDAVTSPTLVAGLGPAREIATARFGSYAVTLSGQVWGWGANDYGQLGQGDVNPRVGPVRVPALGGVRTIGAGKEHVCVLVGEEVFCWGQNGDDQVDIALGDIVMSPTLVRNKVSALALGANHTCVLANDSRVWCWGYGVEGQTGDGLPDGAGQRPTSLDDFVQIAAGGSVTCGVRGDGRVYCWGYNAHGSLGVVSGNNAVPLAVPNVTDAVDVTVNSKRGCARVVRGEVWCWGAQDGPRGSTPIVQAPTLVPDMFGADKIVLTAYETCGVFGDELRCRGWNNAGQLGNGSTMSNTTLVTVPLACQ